jgi:CHAT domain
MPKSTKQLKQLAAKLLLQKGGKHERLQKLIVDGFFDTPKTTEELVTEIKHTSGTRFPSNVVQTYMKKFMDQGIIRVLRSEQHHGNYWIIADEDTVHAGQTALKAKNEKRGISSVGKIPEDFSLPAHPLLGTTKTKILFLAANPTGTTPLALDQECREIEQKIRASDHRDGFEFITKWAVRTGDLLQYLNQHRAHVIHFSGHGSSTEELILLDANNRPKAVSKSALKHLFATLKDNIRVVVLNACHSKAQAQAITSVIDCAIGMKKGIGDQAAIIFAAAFYQALGFGRSVQKAFDSGKAALLLEGTPEEKIPKLLARKGVDPSNIFLLKSDSGK